MRERQIDTTKYGSYICFGVAVLLMLTAICLRSQIQLAVSCVKQAGHAINNMVLILLLPVIQGLGFLLFMMVWTYYGSYLASLGTIEVSYFEIPLTDFKIPVRSYEYNDEISQLGWFLIFCFYWTGSFILAVGEMTVSMAVSKWYFTVDRSILTIFTPLVALWSTSIHHLGTCAFGSLIIAIIRLLRTLLESFKKRVSELTNKKIADCLLCCCRW